MNRYKLYKQSAAICLFIVMLLSCNEEQADVAFRGQNTDNLEIRITTDNGLQSTEPNPDINNPDSINRLDVFVYNETGELFVHLRPSLLNDNIYIATLKDSMRLDRIKDVFVVANLDEQLVETLKTESSDNVKNFILPSPQQFNETDSTFQSSYLMSASALKYNFANDRVLDVQLKRLYSKVRLKFIYDYREADAGAIEGASVEPTFVKVSMKQVKGLPDNVSLFSHSVVTAPSWNIANFPDSIPLLIDGEEITEMNNVLVEEQEKHRIYDFLSNKPYLKLFSTGLNDITTILLSLQFYEKKDGLPVVEFTRDIILKGVEANTDYLITMYINRMDSKTRGTTTSASFNCWYEVSASPSKGS